MSDIEPIRGPPVCAEKWRCHTPRGEACGILVLLLLSFKFKLRQNRSPKKETKKQIIFLCRIYLDGKI